MAVDLAVTIQIITKKNFSQTCSNARWLIQLYLTPNTKPINAKGIAKMVCENFTKLK
jgi:hypothetical protein